MKIDLTLQANFWNTSPSISIKLDNKVIREFNNFVDKQNTIISIETDIEDGEHQLVIEQQNKYVTWVYKSGLCFVYTWTAVHIVQIKNWC